MSRMIVGVDGSEHGAVALRWAAARAERNGSEVVAVLAWTFLDQGHRALGEDLQTDFGASDAKRVLDEAISAAEISIDLTRKTINEPAAEAIVKLAGPEDLIVVGPRGLGGFKGLLLGSVSLRVLELAPCPVAVIHGERQSAGGENVVVAGVDGSKQSLRALRWAATEAASSGESLRIVNAWQVPAYAEMAMPEVFTALGEGALRLVSDAAEDPSLDGVTVERKVVCGGAARALLDHENDASMIVVASRGHGLVKRILLGSTSRQVAHHATVPVVVVPGNA